MEFPCFIFQIVAWILDAVDAGRLHGTRGNAYGLAVASTILGVIGCLFTLYIAIGLSFARFPLADLCGGRGNCFGADVGQGNGGMGEPVARGENHPEHSSSKKKGKDEV